MASSELLIVGFNMIVCLVGAAMCICRMGYMSKSGTKLVIRIQYSIWFGLFVASAISWAFEEPATIIQFAMSCAVLGHLILGIQAWRWGPPLYTIKHDPGYGD